MQKRGHILVTKKLIPLCMKHRNWVIFGSICPDLLLHTFIKGHTYQATAHKVLGKMRALEEEGVNNCWSALQLGMVLHYVEDYFTYPHNEAFSQKTLREKTIDHSLYEENQYEYIREHFPNHPQADKTADIVQWIQQKHEKYQQEIMGTQNDMEYIVECVDCVLGYFAFEFRMNQSIIDMERTLGTWNVLRRKEYI